MFFFLDGSVHLRWNASDQAPITLEPRAYQHDSIRGDLILPNILAVIATTHLDDDHHLPQVAVDLNVSKPDDVIGEKRDGVGAEGQFRKGLLQLDRAQDGDADSCQRTDHPVNGFAKVGAEPRRQCHLKARQRINYQALRPYLLHRIEDLLHGLIHGKIQRTKVEDLEFVIDRKSVV